MYDTRVYLLYISINDFRPHEKKKVAVSIELNGLL